MQRLLRITAACALTLAVAGPAFAADDLRAKAKEVFEVIPTSVPEIKGNAITPARIELGRKLFFDPRLSRSGLISCNTCHNLGMGGDDNLETSIGHGWQKGPRNAPTVLNAVFNIAQFWDGRAEDLRTQAKGPVQAGVEMASTPERVVATLKSMPEYVADFKAAFRDDPDPVSFDNMAKAIEIYEATLITPDSKFDKWLAGDDASMTKLETAGLSLFLDKGCAACHNGVNIGGNGYYPFGVVEQPGADILPVADKGRFAVTKTATEEYVFRAGPLRNIALTAPYFHSGKVWDLEQAVAVMGSSQLGETLSESDVKAITAFLTTLTGVMPKVEYPILPVSTRETPKPEGM
ncbi:cytochrome-c peroxidase [Rhodospirillum rubrum]|uniref:Cytochrome-c peroxidase n=1 Tax=Rhodospirillum rubrum (strain ATCC 11170 / ATH 1.1.1 / DSM 467 / LMG 4362 / NCIMB 8255 / S1) TaxID=269796 RepID=Q2RTF6_RHORT|nr:cytochrome-c peroxidase [Rhodospirillum rubrum]ABC22589.1 Cytochrome-c peroxidase [Rhodospirillum rubrum ATCC 11170]AEO48307.1 cytochrome-c peroxidase [Rhodospirillum rubrum F11]QXG82214.1 cytochrome-c peroxidase [Rhodospirillum rubrum]HAP99403.1 cytochrome C peroxidase [Rhodospirillum rubrum]HCF18035.1 cytochrome C peroxidase [Rhodospirillum rubrum]